MASQSSNLKRKSEEKGTFLSKAKVTKVSQTYREAYSSTWPCLKPSTKGGSFVFCGTCGSHLSIAHGGRDDCRRHVSSKKHQELSIMNKNCKSMDSFMKCAEDQDNRELAVINAETKFAEVIVEMNLPITLSTVMTQVFPQMFPDSDIAKKYASSKSKTTSLINDLATQTQENVTSCMTDQVFSLCTDGSNDGLSKQFPIVVRTFRKDLTENISSQVLSVPVCSGSATGENIFMLLDNELSSWDIKWDNCMALGSDNANVMSGRNKGVFGFLLRKNADIYFSGCSCHLVHLAAEKASSELPVKVEDLLIDVYYYLDKSSKRLCTLREYQSLCSVKDHKILKHVPTRWLSVGQCLSRILEQWEPLLKFMRAEVSNKKTVSRKDSKQNDQEEKKDRCEITEQKESSKTQEQKSSSSKPGHTSSNSNHGNPEQKSSNSKQEQKSSISKQKQKSSSSHHGSAEQKSSSSKTKKSSSSNHGSAEQKSSSSNHGSAEQKSSSSNHGSAEQKSSSSKTKKSSSSNHGSAEQKSSSSRTKKSSSSNHGNAEQKSSSSNHGNTENKSSSSKPKQTSSSSKPEKKKTSVRFGCSAVQRLDRILAQMESERFLLYCHFLHDTIPVFDHVNLVLQQEAPQIHKLRRTLLEFMKKLLMKFVQPKAMHGKEVFEVTFMERDCQKEDEELIIGSAAKHIIKSTSSGLTSQDVSEFYTSVRHFFERCCSYIKKTFPLTDSLLEHAEVVDVNLRETSKFSSLEYFLDRFNSASLLPAGASVDRLQDEFCEFQCDQLNDEIISSEREDAKWVKIASLTDCDKKRKYTVLPHLMLSILTIPHSNAECERIFSFIRKNRTDFRNSLSDKTLQSLMVLRSSPGLCYEVSHTKPELRRLKSAYYQSLKQHEKEQ